mmetsp:Transcript_118409/g.281070  ORF Transcript_118409/g.281070 Transcript_118409/m.281070 type:complete len:85 (+) Transcript_118409:77-331(+)
MLVPTKPQTKRQRSISRVHKSMRTVTPLTSITEDQATAEEVISRPSPSLQSLVDERRSHGTLREKRLVQALQWAKAETEEKSAQ